MFWIVISSKWLRIRISLLLCGEKNVLNLCRFGELKSIQLHKAWGLTELPFLSKEV